MTVITSTQVAAMLAPGLLATALLGGASATAAATAPNATRIEPALELPEPTGRHPVGTSNLRIPGPDSTEIGVSLWYPAADDAGLEAEYVTAERSRDLIASLLGGGATWAPEILSTTRTHATADADALAGSHPVVVALAGLNLPGNSMGGLALDLASHGYVVAAVDWAGDMVAAASIVLDELVASDSVRVDPRRVAVIGHSYGGEAAARVVRADPRFVAGISFDSTFPPDITADTDVPFMMLDTPTHLNDAYSHNWRHLTGWRRWYVIQGSTHSTFTDYPLLFEQLGTTGFEGSTVPRAPESVVVRAYVIAFVDLHLLGTPQPLLEPPPFPEVIFQDPPQQP